MGLCIDGHVAIVHFQHERAEARCVKPATDMSPLVERRIPTSFFGTLGYLTSRQNIP